jgi:riboflavin biosynthesis pyrimidine reductase
VLVYGPAEPPPSVAAPVEVVRAVAPNLRAVLADLRTRGVRALLSEAGPTLTRALLGEGLVDELFLTLSPLLTADTMQPGILAGPALPAPAPVALRWVLRHEDELFLRYGVSPGA